jgi:DNA (cytosine-5)-methyltransferase 1
VEIVAAFDLWELAGKNHHVNFPSARFYPGRLEDVNLRQVAKDVGKIDLILASPECTNHSPAKGNRARCEVSRNTAFEVVRFADKFKPRWIVIENVVSMRRWSRYGEFKAELESLGFYLREQTLDAAAFGVPQSRRRLFLLCDRYGLPDPTPERSGPRRCAQSIVDMNGRFRWSPLRTDRRAAATLERAERGIREVGENTPFLLVYYGSDHAGGWQRLSRPLRTITTLDRFAVVKPSPEGHLMRMLQVPELQLAMGMEGMQFEHGTRRERIKMIGNAVCPPVMSAVIRHLKVW